MPQGWDIDGAAAGGCGQGCDARSLYINGLGGQENVWRYGPDLATWSGWPSSYTIPASDPTAERVSPIVPVPRLNSGLTQSFPGPEGTEFRIILSRSY